MLTFFFLCCFCLCLLFLCVPSLKSQSLVFYSREDGQENAWRLAHIQLSLIVIVSLSVKLYLGSKAVLRGNWLDPSTLAFNRPLRVILSGIAAAILIKSSLWSTELLIRVRLCLWLCLWLGTYLESAEIKRTPYEFVLLGADEVALR